MTWGGAAMLMARVDIRSGAGSRSSPGISRPTSPAVAPQVRHRCRNNAGYAAAATARAAPAATAAVVLPRIVAAAELSADHEHGPVGQVDHLVRGAAENESGQVAPAARSEEDDADVQCLGVIDDLTAGIAENRIPHHAMRLDPGLGQFRDRGIDVRLCLVGRLFRHYPGPGHGLEFPQVQHPYLAAGQ